MNKDALYCADCYQNTEDKPGPKCLEKCDGNGPVTTWEFILKRRSTPVKE